MNLNKQNLINKIIYRGKYRGTKEMDIFVKSFVKSIIMSLTLCELKDLDRIINMNDEVIIKLANKEIEYKKFKNNKVLKMLIDFKKNY